MIKQGFSRILSHSNWSLQKRSNHFVGYLSDVEGDYCFWQRYVSLSKVIDQSMDRNDSTPVLKDNCQFVFGGDAIDKGGMDIAVLNDILSLKNKYPDRVHLLLGNRDVNKMRFIHELTELTAKQHPGVFWTHTKPSDTLEENKVENVKSHHSASTWSDRVNILKWMLEKTMGCPTTFELRKQELQLLRNKKGLYEKVTDEDVVHDFLKRVYPNGEITQYLKHAEIAVVIDDLLFVHGAISEHNLGMYPKLTPLKNREISSSSSSFLPKHHAYETYVWDKVDMLKKSPHNDTTDKSQVLEWVSKLKKFKDEQMDDFITASTFAEKYLEEKWTKFSSDGDLYEELEEKELPTWMKTLPWSWHGGMANHEQDGGALCQYAMFRDGNKDIIPGVIYASNLSDGAPKRLPMAVQEGLLNNGISAVVHGHQPFGDGPLVISHKHNHLKVITSDTSYSNDTLWQTPSPASLAYEGSTESVKSTQASVSVGNGTRGCAVGEVVFVQSNNDNSNSPSSTSSINIHGVLSNGEAYDFMIPPQETKSESSLIGYEIGDGWWTRGMLPNDRVLCSRGEGFKVTNKIFDLDWVKSNLVK